MNKMVASLQLQVRECVLAVVYTFTSHSSLEYTPFSGILIKYWKALLLGTSLFSTATSTFTWQTQHDLEGCD